MRTRVKICGVTRQACLDAAVQLGADAIGFNMYPESPRFLELEAAKPLVSSVPAFVTKVGLFVNTEADVVTEKASELKFDLLQFHGDESNEFCRQFGRPFIKVLRIKEVADIERTHDFPDARGFLFDAHVEGIYGGTGQRISSDALPSLPAGTILAGGLNPDNVAEVIRALKPYSVDVSSGIESSAGVKDPQLMTSFFQAVESADRSKE